MLSEKDKQAILNGVYGVTRDGSKALYIGKDKSDKKYPHIVVIIPKIITDTAVYWLGENFQRYEEEHCDEDIVGLWEDKPEPFNLERALAGEPVLLRNGLKAEVLKALDKPDTRGFQYFGLSHQTNADGIWYHEQGWNAKLKGSRLKDDSEHNYDIIGMWKEPEPVKPSADDLPKPIREFGDLEKVWYVNKTKDCYAPYGVTKNGDWLSNQYASLSRSCYYATKEDCQAVCDWLMNRGKSE